jgi:hypothetical protein
MILDAGEDILLGIQCSCLLVLLSEASIYKQPIVTVWQLGIILLTAVHQRTVNKPNKIFLLFK